MSFPIIRWYIKCKRRPTIIFHGNYHEKIIRLNFLGVAHIVTAHITPNVNITCTQFQMRAINVNTQS